MSTRKLPWVDNDPTTPFSAASMNDLETDLCPNWRANTVYAVGNKVLSPQGVVTCTVAHTSGTTYDWSKFSGDPDYGWVYLGFAGNGGVNGSVNPLEQMQVYWCMDGHSVGGGQTGIYKDPNTGTSFRDPSLRKYNGYWYCAYTVNNGFSKNIGLLRTTDFLNWYNPSTGAQNTPLLIDVSAATSLYQAWAPELQIDTDGSCYIMFTNVIQIPSAPSGLATGTQTTGGTFASGTYYWKVTATNAYGETTGSNEVSLAVTTNRQVPLSWSADSGATGYKVYRGTAAGSENVLVATLGNVTSYTDTGSAGTAATVPTSNTTVNQSIWYVKATDTTNLTTWSAPSAITWASGPGANIWDATTIKIGSTYHMMYAYSGSGPQRATATAITGPYTPQTTGDWASWIANSPANTNFEAPEIMFDPRLNVYRIYMDRYVGTGTYTFPGYCWSETADIVNGPWTAPKTLDKRLDFPPATTLRHGSFVRLTSDTDRNIVLSVAAGPDQAQTIEATATMNGISASGYTTWNTVTIAGTSTNDQFVTFQSGGLLTFVQGGRYAIEVNYDSTGTAVITRSFATLESVGSGTLYGRSPGAAEDHIMFTFPNWAAGSNAQFLMRTYWAFSSGTWSGNATIRITRISR